MAEDIHQHELFPVVVGALRDAIKAHGPITPDLIGSAAKRVVSQVVGFEKNRGSRGSEG